MKNDYARFTAECRTLSLQAAEMEGQKTTVVAASKVVANIHT